MTVPEIPVWRQAPFLRVLLPFACGIIAANYLNIPMQASWSAFTAAILLLTTFLAFKSGIKFRYQWLNGMYLQLLFISLGALLSFYQNITHHKNWFPYLLETKSQLVVRLEEPPAERTVSYKTTASIICVVNRNAIKPAEGKLALYFHKNESAAKLEAGDEIVFSKQPARIQNTGNPGAFEYSQYAAFQNVYHQLYLKENEYSIIRKRQLSFFRESINRSSDWLLKIIRKYIHASMEAGLAEALLIGYKNDLDKTLLQSYSNTGVVHVIAISGLHLGLIYWLLAALLKPIGKGRKFRLLKSVIIIAALWCFSMLAGASPSVLRSALMFTVIVLGEISGRNSSIYNSLAASAFLLLCFNPFWLWDAGFQLSYIAVLSLLLYMKPVYDCLYLNNKLLDKLWSVTAVSLAAQVLTFPLCIYLFHQFPVFFLMSNMVAIPLSSIILLAEIFLCAVSVSPPIAKYSGAIIEWMISLMNRFIQHVEHLPFSTIKEMEMSFLMLIGMYVTIVFFTLYVFYRSKGRLFNAVLFLFFVALLNCYERYSADRQQKLVVYNLKGKAIEIINGRRSMLITTAAVLTNETIRQYTLAPSAINQRIVQRNYLLEMPATFPFKVAQKTVIIVSRSLAFTRCCSTDILILSENPSGEAREQTNKLKFGLLVIDGSNSSHTRQRWRTYCDSSRVACWDVSEKGAFILKLN